MEKCSTKFIIAAILIAIVFGVIGGLIDHYFLHKKGDKGEPELDASGKPVLDAKGNPVYKKKD